MTDFLTDLETQLRDAHPRRRAARRKAAVGRAARAVPTVVLLAAVLAGGATFVVVTDGAPDATAPPPPDVVAAATVPPPPGDVGDVAVLNGTPRPALARDVGDVVALRARVVHLGAAAEQDVEDTVVAHDPEARARGRRLANWLGVDARERTDAERAVMDGAALGVVVGLDTTAAANVVLLTRRGNVVGNVGQILRDGRRFLAVRAALSGRALTFRLGTGRPFAQLRPPADGSGQLEATFSGIADLRSRTVVLERAGTVVASATLPRVPLHTRPAVSILSASAGDRDARLAARLVAPVAPVARLAPDERPARTAVYFVPGDGVLASRIADRIGATPRPFPDALTRARAGDEVGVAVALGHDFLTARSVDVRGGQVHLIRFTDRAVVTVDIEAADGTRGEVVTDEGRFPIGPAAGGSLRATVFVPGLRTGDVRVSVDGRGAAEVPVG